MNRDQKLCNRRAAIEPGRLVESGSLAGSREKENRESRIPQPHRCPVSPIPSLLALHSRDVGAGVNGIKGDVNKMIQGPGGKSFTPTDAL